MPPLLRSSLCVLVLCCILFSNSFCGIAQAESSTEQSYNYAVMPLASESGYDFTVSSGLYDKFTESTVLQSKTYSNLSNGSIVPTHDYDGIYSSMTFDVGSAYCLSFGFSNISIPDGSLLRLTLTDFYSPAKRIAFAEEFYLNPNNAVPYKTYAYMYFTATQVYGDTYSPTSLEQIVPVSNFLRASTNSDGTFLYFDLDAAIPVQADTSSHPADRVINIQLRNIVLYTVYDFSAFTDYSQSETFFSVLNYGDNIASNFIMRDLGDDSTLSSRIAVVYDEGSSGSDIATSANVIQSSITNMGSTLNNQISQVKTQLTQTTNTISTKIDTMTNTFTTKIDTMSQDIQTGLQNVVESAQQNTQNIINTVTQKVDEVKTGITEVKDSIIDLPNKIQEMLIGLVVPDEETINAKYAEFDKLLSDRFGLIYQSADIIHDFADSFQTQAVMTADTGGIISLPSVTVNLAGTAFTFGGYEVDIIPDGFEQLQTAVRLAVSMVCTVVFVNMCKNKLELILK